MGYSAWVLFHQQLVLFGFGQQGFLVMLEGLATIPPVRFENAPPSQRLWQPQTGQCCIPTTLSALSGSKIESNQTSFRFHCQWCRFRPISSRFGMGTSQTSPGTAVCCLSLLSVMLLPPAQGHILMSISSESYFPDSRQYMLKTGLPQGRCAALEC